MVVLQSVLFQSVGTKYRYAKLSPTRKRKTAIAAVLSDIRFKLFQSARLPLLHRRWAGVAKVKIKEEARKHHDRVAKNVG
jgi:hypothetical protein